MAFSLETILTILVLFTGVIYGSSDEWTITPSHPFAMAGKEFNMTCKTGTKTTQILLWQRNDELIRYYLRDCEYDVTNESLKYDFYCTGMISFILVIPATVIDDEHGSQWKCSDGTSMSPLEINVLYGPDRNLTLTGYDGSILHPEQNVTLFCNSRGGRPFANMSWTCGGVSMQGINFNSSDKFVSELHLFLNGSMSGKICTCIATHPTWETPVEINTLPLQVYYASIEAPDITGYTSLRGIREGERINLTCAVLGGYPLPSLNWICGDTLMDTLNKSTEDVAKIVLPLSINRTLHEQQCVCNGSSPANYSRTSNVSFVVYYPPTVTFISKEIQFQNETNYIIFCKVDEGNPTNYGIKWTQVFANTVVRTNTDLSNLLSNKRHNLTLTGISYRDIGEYRCSVHNNVTDIHGNLLHTKSVSIQKNFSAVFASSKVFQAVYGKRFDVKIPFYCQPSVRNMGDLIWLKQYKNETLNDFNSNLTFTLQSTAMLIPFYKKHVRVDGQVAVMMIKVTRYTLEGKYELRVRNMENVYESFEFEIKVKDQKNDDTFVEGTKLETFEPIIISCVVAVVLLAIVVVVFLLWFKKRKKDQGTTCFRCYCLTDKKNNKDRKSNTYAEIGDTKAKEVTKRPGSNPYSEPWSEPYYNINTKGDEEMATTLPCAISQISSDTSKDRYSSPYEEIKDNRPQLAIEMTSRNPYSEPSSLPINTPKKDDKPMAKVNPLPETRNEQNSCADLKNITNEFQGPNAKEWIKQTKPDPVYAEVKKPMRSEKVAEAVNNNQQGVQKSNESIVPKRGCQDNTDNGNLQNDEIKEVNQCEDESKKATRTEVNAEAAANTDQKSNKTIGAKRGCQDNTDNDNLQKEEIKEVNKCEDESKKPTRTEENVEAAANTDQKSNKTIGAKRGCQDNTDNDNLQKEEIKEVSKCEDESKKPTRTEENVDAAASTEQHAKKNAEEVKDGLDYVELELSEQADENTAINSKTSKVDYAEIKTETYQF